MFYVAIGAIALILSGCQNPSSHQATPAPPVSETVYSNSSTMTTAKVGSSYLFDLSTHCAEYFRFDGYVWKADTSFGDGQGNAPRDWPSPVAQGVVKLLNASELTFTLPGKTPVQFHVTSEKLPGCD
jgi:hypothetical protein